MTSSSSTPPYSARRQLLLGAGIAGLASLGAAVSAPHASAANNTTPPGIAKKLAESVPVFRPGDSWTDALATSPAIQLMANASYVIDVTVDLPDGAFILGNGATITVASPDMTAFTATAKTGVTIRDVHFLGQAANPLNAAPNFAHVAIRLSRCVDFRILDNSFDYWLGAGVAVSGNGADDYFSYRGHVHGNNFNRCYFGVSFTDRGEYSQLSNNIFTSNRLAIWNSCGNLSVVGNTVVDCYGAYYAFATTSPYGAQTSDNWNHGSVASNTFNHSNGSGGVRWSTNTAFPIGGVATDPGTGIVISGLLPPTFTANTLWYTNIKAINHAANQWLLTGCALSNLSISCTGANPVKILGYQSNGAANAPHLSGNVSHLV